MIPNWITPDMRGAIIDYCRDNPENNGNKAIAAMLLDRFQIIVNTNQVAGQVHKLGILRGRPTKYANDDDRAAAIREREKARSHHRRKTQEELDAIDRDRRNNRDQSYVRRLEKKRIERAAARQERNRQRNAIEYQDQLKRIEEGPKPELLATPIAARQHDIQQVLRANPALRQNHQLVPKVTLATSSPFSDRVYREPQPAPTVIPKSSLRPRECCWPIGDVGMPGFRYCDTPHANKVYCDEHARMAYARRSSPVPDDNYVPPAPLPKFMAGYR